MLRALLCVLLLCGCASKQLRFTAGAVAADHELASAAGVSILILGGNAVDAAVATSFALSVVRPFSCGIGGGGFMLIDSPEMEPTALNYRERAPAAMHKEFYRNHSSRFGHSAVGVPGTVAGLLAAHQRYGSLPLEVVMEPAISLAEQGFVPDRSYRSALNNVASAIRANPEYTYLKSSLLKIFGNKPRITLKGQADVLKKIASQGTQGFYGGEVAQGIVNATQHHITLEDLQSYEPNWVLPVMAFEQGNLQVYSMPPPSSGGVAIGQILQILERRSAFSLDRNSPTYNHLLIEAMKHAFADRATHMADPAFATVPVDALLDEAYIHSLAMQIDDSQTKPIEMYGTQNQVPDDDGTSHFCVVDAKGMVVCATETINTSFGSLLIVEPFDFTLNNEMDDFSSPTGANVYGLVQSDNNLPEAGKRPLSSMSPVIVTIDGKPVLLLGASGGPRIISSVVQVLINSQWFGDSPIVAIDQPRIHHQWKPNWVYVEEHTKDQLPLEEIKTFGHDVRERGSIGVVQMIQIKDSVVLPACDPRKGGVPAGYNSEPHPPPQK